MKRLRRRILTLCSAVSLLLCVAACVLWTLGQRDLLDRPSITRYHPHGRGSTSIYVNPDGLYYWTDDSTYGVEEGRWTTRLVLDNPKVAGVLGFGIGKDTSSFYTNARYCRVPYWFMVLLTAALPAIQLFTLATARLRHQQGRCPSCGYDLRASPEKCPECGTAATG